MTRSRLLGAVVAVAALAPMPLALAQRDAGPSAEPPTPGVAPPSGSAQAAPPSSGGVAAGASAAPASTAAAPPEADGDEGDHAPATPGPKGVPFQRQPAVLKDGMLRIPGGRFTMGTSDKNAPPNERPSRSVAVPAFWIDRTEVTVAAYRACVERGACARPPRTSPMCTFDLG